MNHFRSKFPSLPSEKIRKHLLFWYFREYGKTKLSWFLLISNAECEIRSYYNDIIATSTIQNWVQNRFFWWNCLHSFHFLFTYVTRRLRFLFQFHNVLRLKFEFTETTRRTTFRFSNFSTKFFFFASSNRASNAFLVDRDLFGESHS